MGTMQHKNNGGLVKQSISRFARRQRKELQGTVRPSRGFGETDNNGMVSGITLTTDFGLDDEYVGLVKGTILSLAPDARIVDLSHGVPPGNLLAAAHLLAACWRHFPQGTVHLAVVDPGVGTKRRLLTLRLEGHFFVGPDNGLFTALLTGTAGPNGPATTKTDISRPDPLQVFEITNQELFAPFVSPTFHGRDIMAPVAARLALGLDPGKVGPRVAAASVVCLEDAVAEAEDGGISGRIVWIDRFGNLVSNIPLSLIDRVFPGKRLDRCVLLAGGHEVRHRAATYAHAPDTAPFFLAGSRATLEIAVKNGNAAHATGLSWGARCRLVER